VLNKEQWAAVNNLIIGVGSCILSGYADKLGPYNSPLTALFEVVNESEANRK